MSSVSLFVPHFHVEECLAEIRKCLEIGWTGLGFKTVEFEEAWKKYTNLPHAHFINSNTIGLQLALKVFKEKYNWNEEDEVITTPLTFVSTNHAILLEGLKPVFADVDETLCLSFESILQRTTTKTKAVMFVGFGGQAGDLEKISNYCREKKIILILDAAHMAGTRVHGQHIGYNVDCSVFSYQAVKNLPTGDSGMICFKNAEDDETVRKMSWLGINKDTFARSKEFGKGNYKWLYDVEYVGYKANGNSIMAAIGLVQLKYLDQENNHRRNICEIYKRFLGAHPSITLIPEVEGCVSSRHLFQIRIDTRERENMIGYLNDHNVHPGVHYRSNLEYRMYSFAKGSCPYAEKVSSEIISLPLHMGVTESDAQKVAETVLNFWKK